MNATISPSMNLIVPTVGVEAGPQFALDINSSLNLIDQHDHSPGKGVLITPAGININTTLAFNGYAASNLLSASFVAGSLPTTTLQALSVATTSSINELYYTDSNGTSTQITKNGIVNTTASSIPGESYNAGTFIWTQTQSAAPTTPANFDIGSVTVRPNIAGTTLGVTISPPSGATYTLTLPILPASTSFLAMSTSGTVSTPVPIAGTAGQYLGTNGSLPIWTTFKAPVTTVYFSGSGTYTVPSGAAYLKVQMVGGGGGGSNGTAGTAGGDTTFFDSVAHGGNPGTPGSGSAGGTGGMPGNASLGTGNLIMSSYGGYGGQGAPAVGANGMGGASFFGGGGCGATAASSGVISVAAQSGLAYGSGGGGALTNAVNFGGGGGGAGGYLEFVLSGTLSSSYAWTVGSAGLAGGTNTGNGASGVVIVTAHYQ